MAAQEALDEVPVRVVQPDDAYPKSTTGRAWGEQFERRRHDKRNKAAGGVVPPQGVSEQPRVVSKKKRGCRK